MEQSSSPDPLLNSLYGIYGFPHAENELKAKMIVTKLNQNLTNEQLELVTQLVKYAYQNGVNDTRQQITDYLKDLSC